LFEGGVKELLIVSQDTSAYGVDVKYRTGFWDGKPVKTRMLDLVAALGDIAAPFGAWVRLHYVYPYPSVDDVVPLMAEGKVLPYLDIPLQHSHPDVLRRMKRPASGERNLERIQQWRSVCPELVVRSTFIAGFPGETQDDVEDLKQFLIDTRLDRVGIFTYSHEENTTAHVLDDTLSSEEKEARAQEIMEVQQEISLEKNQERVGNTYKVIVDKKEAGRDLGRTEFDSVEVDNEVSINTTGELQPGDFVHVTITKAYDYDLEGEIV
jgi:ribosomal protein S12 methylthiotransferase